MTAAEVAGDAGAPELRGRRAVVTGAAGEVGGAVARALLAAGASVVLLDVRPCAVPDAPPGATAVAVVADVTDPAAMLGARSGALDRLGGVDLVVAAAGVVHGAALEESSPAQLRRVVDVNLTGALVTARTFVEDLLAAAGRGGPADLVLTGSTTSHLLLPRFPAYAASAAGTAQLARTLRAELGPRGVRAEHVELGAVDTPVAAGVADPASRAHLGALRRRRPLTAQDVAEAVLFAVSAPPEVNVAELVVTPTWQD